MTKRTIWMFVSQLLLLQQLMLTTFATAFWIPQQQQQQQRWPAATTTTTTTTPSCYHRYPILRNNNNNNNVRSPSSSRILPASLVGRCHCSSLSLSSDSGMSDNDADLDNSSTIINGGLVENAQSTQQQQQQQPPPCLIRVLGVGGGGGNAVNRMIQTGIEGVSFWAINTDVQALTTSLALNKLNIGPQLTRGLGAGGNPTVGKQAAEETRRELRALCEGVDMIFVTAGMGGGTGSGAAPVVAEVAKDCGCLTVAVVTKPFRFEGKRRLVQAEQAIAALKPHVDTMIVVSNDKLLRIVPEHTSLTQAFEVADDILRQGVVGISEIILKTGLVNVDFADVRQIMSNAGTALMGVGNGIGKNRAADAAVAAISSPLLDFPIQQARGIVFNIVGDTSMSLEEVNAAAEVIAENASPEANIIFGALVDDTMPAGEMSVTVLACDFEGVDVVVASNDGAAAAASNSNNNNKEMMDPSFYKTRRQNTKSPLGPEARSVDETRIAITRGGFIKPPPIITTEDDDNDDDESRRPSRLRRIWNRFTKKKRGRRRGGGGVEDDDDDGTMP